MRAGGAQSSAELCSGEGLVIKNPMSTYTLNGREDAWIKLKPDYMDGMGENFELVVTGAYYGTGNRGKAGRVGSFMCSLRDGNEPDKYYSFAKVGSGLSYAVMEQLESFRPHFYEWPKTATRNERGEYVIEGVVYKNEKPDLLIRPDKSFTIRVLAAEIIASVDEYGAGACLRFPRCQQIWYSEKFLEDHPVESVMTMGGASTSSGRR